ncbi:Unconventional Myosin-Ie [Manis pentadactyla]|nr:Unconventional Myosin-Ie [Manis pentadactyla]
MQWPGPGAPRSPRPRREEEACSGAGDTYLCSEEPQRWLPPPRASPAHSYSWRAANGAPGQAPARKSCSRADLSRR